MSWPVTNEPLSDIEAGIFVLLHETNSFTPEWLFKSHLLWDSGESNLLRKREDEPLRSTPKTVHLEGKEAETQLSVVGNHLNHKEPSPKHLQ